MDNIRNEEIRKEVEIISMEEKRNKYKLLRLKHIQRMSPGRISKQACNLCRHGTEENIWVDRVHYGKLKPEKGILLVPEVTMMIYVHVTSNVHN
jgi:hypothetical protein